VKGVAGNYAYILRISRYRGVGIFRRIGIRNMNLAKAANRDIRDFGIRIFPVLGYLSKPTEEDHEDNQQRRT
jgi:hypothetical protein